ncbi:MAG: protein kinase [Planctomycetales bacterium]
MATEFLQLLENSNLLAPDAMAAAQAESSDDAKSLAQSLVQQDVLTRWQARQLLRGRQSFFVGRYKLIELIGEGGMGAVFKAEEQGGMRRTVALKVMNEELLEKPKSLRRFLREVKAAALLNHPNIVTSLDADSVGEAYFLVMEYVEGKDLHAWVKEHKRLPIDWACECIRQAAIGLQHAHKHGMVHRDVKPSNLLVICDSTRVLPVVKILDMGLVRFTDPEHIEDDDLTVTGEVLGSVDYVAPEQAADAHSADVRSDIYSLGCTLFHLISGRIPFNAKTPAAKLMARATSNAPSASSINSRIPPDLDEIVSKMLHRDPDQRYQTPLEVAEALEPFALSSKDEEEQSNLEHAGLDWNARDLDPDAAEDEDDSGLIHDFLGKLANQAVSNDTRTEDLSLESRLGETDVDSEESQPAEQPVSRVGDAMGRVPWPLLGFGALVVLLLLLVGFVLRQSLPTGPTGTVPILVDQPAATITIEPGGVSRTSPLIRERLQVRLPAGSYVVTVSKPGFEDWVGHFTIAEEQEAELVRVKLTPKK